MKQRPDEVKFQAKIGDWVCIKKGKFKDNSNLEKLRAAKLLASIHNSFKRKTWEYLDEEIEVGKLDKIAYEITDAEYDEKKDEYKVKGRVSNKQIARAFQDLKNKVPRMIDLDNTQLREVAKTYVTRKVLDLLKIRIDPKPKTIEKYIKDKRIGKV